MNNCVLIVEDDESFAANIRAFLERFDFDVHTCESAEEALRLVESVQPDIVLADQTLPGMTGTDLLRRLINQEPEAKVIMMTGDDRAHTAVEAMKAGAYDYLTKPLILAELKIVIDKACAANRMEKTLAFHQERQASGSGVDALIGQSRPMLEMKNTIRQIIDAERRLADADMPAVLITGETGTGKELVARSMHFDGLRHKAPFVEINCGSIPTQLLEAELFGHEKGAFTDAKERKVGLVEAADGGTLFLDEIGEVDPMIQAKLLKLLEEKMVRRIGSVKERKVNIRIISATNRDLEQMVRDGKFRSDLYFRLRIISIKVPPLRARGDDVLLLARHYLATHGRRYGKPRIMLSEAAEQVLTNYYWPGNVRELRNMLEQTVLLAGADIVTPDQLAICPGLAPQRESDSGVANIPAATPASIPSTNPTPAERDLLVKTLEKTDWNVSKSAKLLGLSRDMMRYRMEKLGLSRLGE